MLLTGVRQVRMVAAMIWGRRIDPRNVARLVDDARATLEEFGAPGEDAQQVVDGPLADPETRVEFQNRALRRTARRLARTSPFYAERLPDVRGLTVDTLTRVPVTTKRDLLARPRDFVCSDSTPHVATRTSGTTGHPATLWLSRYETELWPAMLALAMLIRGEITGADRMQMAVSSRATAAIQIDVAMCRLAGARVDVSGLIPPEECLDALLDPDDPPTLLNTYPSYLAQLVQVATRRGLGPRDFRLRTLNISAEMLSPALATAARETFGGEPVDSFGMTEVLPVSGRTCSQGHLHLDINNGLVEVLDVDTGRPAEPGGLGTLVVTPYLPYRECMPVFRYDTRDLVRAMDDGPLSCELSAVPATSPLLGKADHLLRPRCGTVTPRDVVEVLDGLPSRPWPVRYAARVRDGDLHVTVPDAVLGGLREADVVEAFARHGIPDVRLAVHRGVAPPGHRPLRADLVEVSRPVVAVAR